MLQDVLVSMRQLCLGHTGAKETGAPGDSDSQEMVVSRWGTLATWFLLSMWVLVESGGRQ